MRSVQRMLFVGAVCGLAGLLTGCFGGGGGSAGIASSGGGRYHQSNLDAGPNDFIRTRSYVWQTPVQPAQPDWHPIDARLIARGDGALLLFDEGDARPVRLRVGKQNELYDPQWVSADGLIYGPQPLLMRDEAGDLVIPSTGVWYVQLGQRSLEEPQILSEYGYSPRVWGDQIVIQDSDQLLLADDEDPELLDNGFAAVPDRGERIAFQTRPLLSRDWWTAIEDTGNMVIRWNDDEVDLIPGGIQAAWCPWGGIVVTQIDDLPDLSQNWWMAGTRLVYISGPGAEPVLIGIGLRDPAPHPHAAVIAAVTQDERLVLAGVDGSRPRRTEWTGRRPQWHPRGDRLLAEQDGTIDKPGVKMRVHAFTLRNR